MLLAQRGDRSQDAFDELTAGGTLRPKTPPPPQHRAPQALHLSLQRLDPGRQRSDLLLLLGDHPQQVISTQPCNVVRCSHGVNCRPIGRRLQAEAANQLPVLDLVYTLILG